MTNERLARIITNGIMTAIAIFVIAIVVSVAYAIASGDPWPLAVIAVGIFGFVTGFTVGSKLKGFAFRQAARDVGRKYEFRERR
jgi:hydrogenase/urease accessory protein HupE